MPDIEELIVRSKLNFKEKALQVEIIENDEQLVSQNELERNGFVCRPFWKDASNLEGDAYSKYIMRHPSFNLQLRESVALRLLEAEKLLPDNFKLILKAGFRPFEVQIELLDALVEDTMRRQANLNYELALSHARQYVADPRLVCPPHTTGGAVDIDVLDTRTGNMVDMGCPPNTDDGRAALHSSSISSVQYENRLILLEAMLKAGFAPLHNEWWHYSFGETRWAAFYGKKRTLYGIIRKDNGNIV